MPPAAPASPPDADPVFAGPGEMRARCRAVDWAATPLGPVAGWSPTLRTAAQMVLAAGLPNILLWGRGLTQLYNDAYATIIGAKHPHALGRGNAEVWPEVWHLNGPIYERVFAGETVVLEDALYPLARGAGGGTRDAYLTVAFSPVRDGAGAVAGVLANMIETTTQVELRGAQEAVRAHYARFRAVQDASPDAFVLARAVRDAGGAVVDFAYEYANPAAEAVTAHVASQLVGRRMLELFPGLAEAGLVAAYARVMETGIPFQAEAVPVGGALAGVFRVTAVRAAADELAVTFSDVSERARLVAAERAALAQARAAREHLERVISQAPVSMYIARGREHVYEVVNDVWCAIVRRTPAEVLGRSVIEVFPEVERQGIRELVERVYDSGEPAHFPSQRIELDFGRGPEEHFFNIVYQPLRDADGAVYAMAVVATDVTELALARRDAEAARAVAEAANRAKGDFLAVMSHELRTPLNAIQGYAELLELGIHGPVTGEQLEALRRIRTSQRHLLGLVNGVLNYARVESGTVDYHLERVPLAEVLATCEALVAPQAQARRLALDVAPVAPGLAAVADAEKVQQILLNLLSNAVKFTDAAGRVALWCDAADDQVHVRVRDSGRGIAAAQLERIFEPFVQVDARLTRTQEGTGLGLAISRDLARGMGGDLLVESAPGAGSTFTLALRRA